MYFFQHIGVKFRSEQFPCSPRLVIQNLIGTWLSHIDGLWGYAVDAQGNYLTNAGYPYYKQRGSNMYMWWMWHGNVGHWVVNDTPGAHGDDQIKSVMGDFKCPSQQNWIDPNNGEVNALVK